MARQHLRESFLSKSNREYILLDETKSQKFQEAFDNRKSRLKEDSNDTIRILKALKEDARSDDNLKAAVESVLSKLQAPKEETPKFKVWKFPIGRYDVKNANGRIYPKALYQNVCDNQRDIWQNLCGLADHPKEDNDAGSFKDQAIVWLDMDVGNDGLVYGYGSFVGTYGQLAQDIIEKGGRIGFSTSGFGDVDRNTHIVDPDTFSIERISDIVLNPSQSVYGEYSDPHMETAGDPVLVEPHQTIEYNKKEPVSVSLEGRADTSLTESIHPQSKILKEKETKMAAVDIVKESEEIEQEQDQEILEETGKKISDQEEKRFRKYVEAYMKDIGTKENPIDRLQECAEILEMFEDGMAPDLKESVEIRLVEYKKSLEKIVESALSTQKELGVDLERIKEDTPRIIEKAIFLKDQATDFKELSEALTERNVELSAEVKSLKDQLKETKKGTSTDKIVAKLTEEKEKLENKLNIVLKRNGKTNEALQLRIKSLRDRLDEAVSTIDETSHKGDKRSQRLLRSKKDIETQLKAALEEEKINLQKAEEESKKLAESIKGIKEGRREALTEMEMLKLSLSEEKIKTNRQARKITILESKAALEEEKVKKAEINKNTNIVSLKEKVTELEDSLRKARIELKNSKIIKERTSNDVSYKEVAKMKSDTEKLNETNKVLEKKNGVLETKIKEAAGLLTESKRIREAEKAKVAELTENNIILASNNKKLTEDVTYLTSRIVETEKELKDITNQFIQYKEAVADKTNPISHFQPKFETRVGKFLNFRENMGQDVEAYWGDLVNRYGEAVAPYERHIRGAKTLQEATASFLKFKDYIDPRFTQVREAIIDESAIHSKADRAKLLEHAGVPVYQDELTLEERNRIALEKMRKAGFQY